MWQRVCGSGHRVLADFVPLEQKLLWGWMPVILLGGFTHVSGIFRTSDYARGIWRQVKPGVVVPHGVLISSMSGLLRKSETTIYKTADHLVMIKRSGESGCIYLDGCDIGSIRMNRKLGVFYTGSASIHLGEVDVETDMPSLISQNRRSVAHLYWLDGVYDVGVTRLQGRENWSLMAATHLEQVEQVLGSLGREVVMNMYRKGVGVLGYGFGFSSIKAGLFDSMPALNDPGICPESMQDLASIIGVETLEAICLWLNVWAYI